MATPPRKRTTPRSALGREVGKRSPFDSPEQEAYLNLVRTHAVLSGAFARLFKAHAISEPQYNVLRIVAGGSGGVGGGRTMDGISCDMVARDPDVTRLVDRLEDAGLVARHRSDADRRVVVVRITPKGRGLLRRLHEPVLELHRSQLGALGEARLRTLSDLLAAARHAEGGGNRGEGRAGSGGSGGREERGGRDR